MHIIVDAMGGDDAPQAVVAGCKLAVEHLPVTLTLVGREKQIRREMELCGLHSDKVNICHAEEEIMGEDDPVEAIRKKKDSSMRVALSLLKDGQGDAVVSAGNTGALIAGTTLLIKRLKGVRRVALAPIMPSIDGCFLLLDAGANAECTPMFLEQFALMGSVYMERVMQVKQPKVKLVNIGTEEEKGTPLITKTHARLKELPIAYQGYIEAREIPLGGADVVVCDGFCGNVILKCMEGMGVGFVTMLKKMFTKNLATKAAAGMMRSGLLELKQSMDYTEYGGAPILGAAKPVIKAHGSSNDNAFYHAIRQAVSMVENQVVAEMAEYMEKNAAFADAERTETSCFQKS